MRIVEVPTDVVVAGVVLWTLAVLVPGGALAVLPVVDHGATCS